MELFCNQASNSHGRICSANFVSLKNLNTHLNISIMNFALFNDGMSFYNVTKIFFKLCCEFGVFE